MDDNRAQIFEIKEKICRALNEEEKSINSEIKELRDHKVTIHQIEKGELQLNGISYTSTLVYLNETTPETESHK